MLERPSRKVREIQMLGGVGGKTDENKRKLLWSQSKRLTKQRKQVKGSFRDENNMPPETEEQSLDNMAVHLSRVSSPVVSSAPQAQQMHHAGVHVKPYPQCF